MACLSLLAAASSVVGAGSGPALSEAIQSGDRAAIVALARDPAAVRAAEPDGTTPLHWAARVDDLDTANLLLAAGADVHAANRYGVTPLSLAAVNGNATMIERLLAAGADANETVSQGQTVLMTAARTGNADAVRVLLEHGAEVDAREAQLGETALMWAASENHAAAVSQLLAHGAEVNLRSSTVEFPRDRFGLEGVLTILPHGDWTPLMYAARDGAPDASRVLIEAGAELDAVDPDGTTALVLAITNSHYDTANVLLEAGADPNIADSVGMAALYAAVDMSSLGEVYGRPPRNVDDELTPVALIQRLIAHGAVVDALLERPTLQRAHTPGEGQLGAGTTSLMRASRNGDHAAVRILLQAGTDPTLAQPNGTTALMMASGLGRGLGVFADDVGTEADLRTVCDLLIARGVNVNDLTDAGLSAVHIAAQGGLDTVVSLLAEHGAQLDGVDKRGRTPADMARGVGGRGRAGGPPPVYDHTAELIERLLQARAVTGAAADAQ